MFLRMVRYALCEEAGGSDGGGSSGGASGASGDTPNTEGTGTSLLGEAAAADVAWMPEKYRVNGEDGALDVNASARKLAEGYGSLSARFGTGEVRPESIDGYAPAIEVDGFAWDEVKGDQVMQDFVKEAHAKGLTNDQLNFALNAYFRNANELMQAKQVATQEQARTALREVWKDDAAFNANVQGAYRALAAYSDKAGVTLEQLEREGLANNPTVIRLLAAVAPELREDTQVTDGQAGGASVGDDIETVMQSDAYRNANHPEHAKVSAQVRKHFEKKYGTAPVI